MRSPNVPGHRCLVCEEEQLRFFRSVTHSSSEKLVAVGHSLLHVEASIVMHSHSNIADSSTIRRPRLLPTPILPCSTEQRLKLFPVCAFRHVHVHTPICGLPAVHRKVDIAATYETPPWIERPLGHARMPCGARAISPHLHFRRHCMLCRRWWGRPTPPKRCSGFCTSRCELQHDI